MDVGELLCWMMIDDFWKVYIWGVGYKICDYFIYIFIK